MTTKKPSKKSAATAAPKKNKQRLVLLTAREIAAATRGGCLDAIPIPEAAVRKRLANEATALDADAIVRVLAKRVGWVRVLDLSERNHMEPREIADQAQATADVVAEMLTRLQHMHPSLHALIDVPLYRVHGLSLHQVQQRVEPDLLRLAAALKKAREEILRWPRRTGPKHTERQAAVAAVAVAIRKQSTPPYPLKESRALAAELLALCLDASSVRKSA